MGVKKCKCDCHRSMELCKQKKICCDNVNVIDEILERLDEIRKEIE